MQTSCRVVIWTYKQLTGIFITFHFCITAKRHSSVVCLPWVHAKDRRTTATIKE